MEDPTTSRARLLVRKYVRSANFIPWCLLVVFTAVYFSGTVGISNSQDGPDYALTRAIVEQRTTQIGAYPQWINPDYAIIDNHVYAKRSPGFSILGIPIYLLALTYRHLATAPYNWQHVGLNGDSPTEALAMLYPALCGSLTVVLFYLICVTLTRHRVGSLLAAVTLGFGTLLWRYSISYQRMPLYILLLTLLFYLAIRWERKVLRDRDLFLVGVVMGYTVVTESTAVFVLPLYFGWFVSSIVRREGYTRAAVRPTLVLAVGGLAGVSVLLGYNLFSFGHLYENLYQDTPGTRWESFSGLFSTPLWPSIWLNLFSHGPIPLDALSPVIRNNPAIMTQQSANWALKTEYDGLLFQSPYFLAAALGQVAFVRQCARPAALALGSAAVILVVMSSFATFYSANLFDGRYFTPMLPFLSVGLAYFWRAVPDLWSIRLKLLAAALGAALSIWSIYNGWVFELTNYGPHVTGNNRFLLSYLTGDRMHNLGLLWTNTFPNVFNLWILLVYSATGALIYLTYESLRDWIVARRGATGPVTMPDPVSDAAAADHA